MQWIYLVLQVHEVTSPIYRTCSFNSRKYGVLCRCHSRQTPHLVSWVLRACFFLVLSTFFFSFITVSARRAFHVCRSLDLRVAAGEVFQLQLHLSPMRMYVFFFSFFYTNFFYTSLFYLLQKQRQWRKRRQQCDGCDRYTKGRRGLGLETRLEPYDNVCAFFI